MSDHHQAAIAVDHDIYVLCTCVASLISAYSDKLGHGPVCANLDKIQAAYDGLRALRNRINSTSTTPTIFKQAAE